MYKLIFLFKEFSELGFKVQIDQIHGMGEFIHQST